MSARKRGWRKRWGSCLGPMPRAKTAGSASVPASDRSSEQTTQPHTAQRAPPRLPFSASRPWAPSGTAVHSSQLRIIGEGACKAPDPPGRPPGCCLSPPGPLAPLPRCPAIPQTTQGARLPCSSSPAASQLAAAAAAAHPPQGRGLAGVRGTSSCGHHGVLAVWQEEDASR